MQPIVSVLIDTYNHERFIEQAIVSVLEQGLSASEIEIVVVDDGSSDGTAEIVRKFAPRVRIFIRQTAARPRPSTSAFPKPAPISWLCLTVTTGGRQQNCVANSKHWKAILTWASWATAIMRRTATD